MNPEQCRTCLKQTNLLKNVIELYSTKHNQTFFETLTNIEINDEIPKFICISCEKFISSAIEFQEMCKKSNEQLETDQGIEDSEDSSQPETDSINPSPVSEIQPKTNKNQTKFLCAVCGSSFAAKHSLQSHMNIHNDLRPYQCEICSKSFRHKGNLIDHKLFVHSEKMVNCNLCSKKFQTNAVLKIHLKTHNQSKIYFSIFFF